MAEDPRASLEPALGTARYYGLGPAAARGVLAEVSASVDRWRAEARRFGAGRAEVDRMASAFEHPERDRARAGAGVV